jgi:hypothetical protein
MKKILTLFVFFSLFAFDINAQSITRLIGSSPFQDSLWVFDTTNFNVVRRFGPAPSSGGAVTGTTGMAKNPLSGNIYVVFKQSAVSGRVLAKFSPLTGIYTIVGNLGDNFSSITFTSDGKLYGATGNGASVPETLYQIDTLTAAKRLVKSMGNGVDGEILCYNPDDNMIYHWSGNGTIVYEKFDTISGPYNFINIPIIGTTAGETFGMVYRGNGVFIGSNIGSRFQLWNTSGNVFPQIGATSPDDIRGTVFLTCPRAITGNPAFCTGSSTTLTHSDASATAYQWYFNGAIIAGATSQTYAANQIGHYNCIVSDACGTDSSGTGFNVTTQNPLPVVTVSSSQTNLCPGGSITINGTNGGTLQWYMNGTPISGANTSSYTATAAGVYNETKTNLNGCTDSAAVGITIVAVPNPVVNLGNDTAFCAGNMHILDAMNPGAAYLWSPSGNTMPTETVSTTGTYAVMVTDTNGCMASDTINVTVHALPVVNLGNDTSTCAMPVTLDAGNPGATYLWCDGSTTQMATFSSSTNCAVMVTDANGCMNSDTITVSINSLPVVSVSTADTSLCPSDSIMISGSPAGGIFSGAGISGNTFSAFNAGSGTHTITYMYTDANGCSSSDSLQMFVTPVTLVGLTASDNTVCIDDADVILTGSPSGGVYSGTGVSGNTFDPTVAGAGGQVITYTYTDANSCIFTGTTSLFVSLCTGVEEQVAANGFSIFPNPANAGVQIVLGDDAKLSVFNSLGEIVMEAELTAGTHSINTSTLSEGIYLVRTQNANGISTQRLIINR